MRYATPLKGELADAYLSMPKTADEHVVSLFYAPAAQLPAYEAAWREWLAAHPKRLWPEWVDAWAQKRNAEARRVAA